MNRNTEWECLVNEIKGSLPSKIERSAERAVSRMKTKRNIDLFVKVPIVGFFAFFVAFATLENTSGKFFKTTKNIPILGRFAKLVILNRNIRGL